MDNSIIESKTNNQIKTFDGELLHPSLDIKDNILVLGFRYRTKPNEEENLYVVVNGDSIGTIDTESFTANDKTYYFEKWKRKLMRIDEKWSIAALQHFLNEHKALLYSPISPKLTFENIVVAAKRFTELEQEIDYWLLAAWIIGTYCYPIFSAYPFLHIKAPKRSGKSQCLNFLSQLCFNAIKAHPSLAALSDTVDALRGTYLIDQADSLERKGNEELLDILADSYKRSGGKRRVIEMNKRGGRETLEFETYSPKAFASIRELPEDLRDRCLVVPLIRSKKNFPDPDDSADNWREARGELYQLLINNYTVITACYTVRKINYRNDPNMLGRSLELWLPFEVILESCGMQEKIADAKNRFLSQYGFTEYEPSEYEEEVVKAILCLIPDAGEAILTPKQISETLGGHLFEANDTQQQRASKVGWTIKKFNLSSEKMPRTKDGVRYRFQLSKVEGILQSYFKSAPEPTPPTPDENIGINEAKLEM